MSSPITADDLLKLTALRSQPALHAYFFSKIESPLWIEPLRKAGFFDRPPEPEKMGGPIVHPPWPESRYLARVTPSCTRAQQEMVADILLDVQDKSNYLVRQDILDAILAMPAILAVRFTDDVITWLPSNDRFLLPERAGQLMARVADGGYLKQALVLARALLRLRPDKEKADADARWSRTEPKSVYEEYAFEQVVVKYFPRVVAAAGTEALSVLCEALSDGLRYFKVSYVGDDNSDLNISSVESIDGVLYPNALGTLVEAIRSAGEQLVGASKTTVTDVVYVLMSHRARIFRRLAMHLLAKWPDKAPGEMRRFLLDRNRFRELDMIPEYRRLLRTGFPVLSDDDKRRILGWLVRPPKWRAIDAFDGQPISLATRRGWSAKWRLDRLRPIAGALDGDWHAKYETLLKKFGSVEEPPTRFGARIVPRPESPLTESELMGMSVAEIVAFLESWHPRPRRGLEPGQDIAGVLSQVASKRASEFAAAARDFTGQRPENVRALLSGLKDALKTQVRADWNPLLDLCMEATASQAIDQSMEARTQADESRWTHLAVASFVEEGLQTNSFALGDRDKLWLLIERLASHPNPAREDDGSFDGDTFATATNSVRSLGIQTAIEFGLWYHRATDRGSNQKSPGGAVLDDLPELRVLLDEHLDPNKDPSGAVRSVYGRLYPWLMLLDEDWAKARASVVFPLDEDSRYLLDAAWSSFLRFSRAFDATLEPLRSQYRHTVESAENTKLAGWARLNNLGQYVAEHLMFYMWRGVLKLEDPLLTAFWEKSDPDLRRFALDFVGRTFRDAKEDIPSEVIERTKALWESRAQAIAQATKGTEELAAFGMWFGSGKFEAGWSLRHLRSVLEVVEDLDDTMRVMDRLAQLASTYPRDCVACLALLNKKGRSVQYIVTVREEQTRAILNAAYQSGDSEASDEARVLVKTLANAGYYDYRDIVKPRNPNHTK